MRVSVVIPTYNSAALVVEAVASVLAQTLPAFEIIVIDDGSTDDTATRLQHLPVTLIQQSNGGVADARNRGVASATGDLIAFLDADDVWHPQKLAVQVPLFESDLGLLGTGHYDWPTDAVPKVPATLPAIVPVELDRLVIRNSLVTSTVIVRSSVLRAVGEFDRRLHGPEDYDLWLRVAQQARCGIVPVNLTGYRTVAGSLSKNAVRMDEGMKLILDKLDTAGVFRGKQRLRRQAHGYYHYSAGFMHHTAGHRTGAVKHLLKSLLTYPGSYSREDVRYRFGRLRLLAAALKGTS
ncbi:hypothetical protein BH11PLA2_BH11PLA2_05050 [soil metagenome]